MPPKLTFPFCTMICIFDPVYIYIHIHIVFLFYNDAELKEKNGSPHCKFFVFKFYLRNTVVSYFTVFSFFWLSNR